MRLKRLVLSNFRNHRFIEIDFEQDSMVIVGANTAGKTNVLEAIYLLAMGESFREGKVEEMVAWNTELGRVQGLVQNFSNSKFQIPNKSQMQKSNDSNMEETELEVVVTRGVVQGQRVAKRKYLVNGVGRSKRMLLGNLRVVSFRPEDMRVVEGSPGRRRRFLDDVLVQVDNEYARSLMAYGKALVRRNRLLDMIRDGKTQRTALAFWDQMVIKNGEYLQQKRREYEEFLNTWKSHQEFGLQLEYKPSVISEKRLAQYSEQEVMAGYQLVGPHRDDFKIISVNSKLKTQDSKIMSLRRMDNETEEKDLAVYGSRGEQRLGVLWLKMQAMEFVEQKAGERPVLLLDDIFSELDHEHRELVLSLFGRQQTIVTTADAHHIEDLDGRVEKVVLKATGNKEQTTRLMEQ